jgi:hypothetical protein
MKRIKFKEYIAKLGYQPIKTWKNESGYYAQIKGTAHKGTSGVTQVLQGGTILRLSLKDVSNSDIVGKDTEVIFENKITKNELRQIIREELHRINELGNEDAPSKGDYVKYYELEGGKKYPWYIMYVDSTHVDVTNKEPKKGQAPGAFVAHIGQLKHRDYYNDMIKWMKTGDKKNIDGKTYKAASER